MEAAEHQESFHINAGVLKFGFLLSFGEQRWRKVQQPQEKPLN